MQDAEKIVLIEPAACEGSSIEVIDRSCQYSLQSAPVAVGSVGMGNLETLQEQSMQDPTKTRTTEGNEDDQEI